MVLNPDVFTPIKTTGSEEEIKGQEEAVREASSFLNSIAISRLVRHISDSRLITWSRNAHAFGTRWSM